MSFLVSDSEIVFVVDDAGVFSLSLGTPVSSGTGTATTTISLSAGLVTDTDNILPPAVAAAAGAVTLSPALVTDADAFPAPVVAAGAVTLAPALVTDSDLFRVPVVAAGAVALSPALVSDDDTFPAPLVALPAARTLLPALVNDADSVPLPTVGITVPQVLLPSRIVDADTFYAPAMGFDRTLRPPLVSAAEAVYPAYGIDIIKAGHDQKLHWNFLSDPDTIYPPFFPRTPLLWVDRDTIFAPWAFANYVLQAPLLVDVDTVPASNIGMSIPAALVANDDAIYRPGITLFLVPQLLADAEAIPAADVGWKVFARFTGLDDSFFAPYVQAWNDLRPDVWLDEEHLEGYPFKVQSIEGGIKQPRPPGVLTGSVSHARRLTGSVKQRVQLTGSVRAPRRVLTGSLRQRR